MHISEGIITGYPAAAYNAGGPAPMAWGPWRLTNSIAQREPYINHESPGGVWNALLSYRDLYHIFTICRQGQPHGSERG